MATWISVAHEVIHALTQSWLWRVGRNEVGSGKNKIDFEASLCRTGTEIVPVLASSINGKFQHLFETFPQLEFKVDGIIEQQNDGVVCFQHKS